MKTYLDWQYNDTAKGRAMTMMAKKLNRQIKLRQIDGAVDTCRHLERLGEDRVSGVIAALEIAKLQLDALL